MTRARKPTWSFVVMRGADKTVKQFSVSKRSVVAAPMAAVLAVSGCIAGLQIKAAYELKHLEEELSSQSAQFTRTITGMDDVIAGKDEAIVSLQQEILELSRQTQEMKKKMQELNELEAKLKLFIEKYGSSTLDTTSSPSTKSGSVVRTLSAYSDARGNAVYSPAPQHTAQIASLAQHTSLDLQALSLMVDSMETSMEQTLKQAQQKRMTVDAFPNLWPTRSKQLTSGFGYRRDPFTGRAAFHAGIDIDGKSGDAVFSAADGTVSEVGYDSQFGNYVIIKHLGDLQTAYMHLKQIDAREGDLVVRGEKIGQLGSSGRSTGPHLHFQIMQRSEPVNPLKYLATRS
ncbi:peptidoglycan DD-metalloendopeptidase family protein [Paenibacillus sp. LHD-117]|uniref:peptidoglycan DD-metalloendopeptidase family protein n=1 Tax=Paenibacillus sp. LHD-117 TaxID=3071412 RepID=UPI0027E1D995|nr:peptidoglycan DD-metalloendopeptidase family protein [Paenibacillus sp. LHD-117]MDQ6421160.1 peptidoglycan DD-metalloendopeptidase family protein [Paenibacillus sp. LHD-117]